MADVYLGQITLMANTFAPRGWHVCDGSLIGIPQNTALFALIGTNFGGDGVNTFGIPDLRSRVPVGVGAGPGLSTYTLGQKGGTETMTLTAQNVAPHTHTGGLQATGAAPRGGSEGPPATGNFLLTVTTVGASPSPTLATLGGVTVNPNSGGTPFSVLQPFQAVNFFIALQGIFPSRN